MSEAEKSLEPQVEPTQEPIVVTEPTPTPTPATPTPEAAAAATAAAAEQEKPAKPAAAPTKGGEKSDELSELKAQLKASADRALRSEATSAALRLGVAQDKLPYALKLADLAGIDINAEDAGTKIDAAMAAVLEGLPELRGVGGTGSLGNFQRTQPTSDQEKARAEFQRGLDM